MLCLCRCMRDFALGHIANAYADIYGGEGGIRTLDALLTHTPLAGERFQPLSHFTGCGL